MKARILAAVLAIAAIAGCAAAPAPVPAPEVVKVPVYSCPAPPAIAAPYEPVYDLRAVDVASPDKVMKSAGATIGSLEASLDECQSALAIYRAEPVMGSP